jgi:hypothetical protein
VTLQHVRTLVTVASGEVEEMAGALELRVPTLTEVRRREHATV